MSLLTDGVVEEITGKELDDLNKRMYGPDGLLGQLDAAIEEFVVGMEALEKEK